MDDTHPRLEHRNLSTAELVRRAIEGEAGSFASLYSRTAPALYVWVEARISKTILDHVAAEDIVQETYLRAYDRFESFDADRSFRSWLFGIANNVARESVRSLARAMLSGDETLNEVPAELRAISQEVVKNEALGRLLERIHALPETERKIVLYRGLEGVSHREVAELLGISVSNAEKTWQRVRDQLATSDLPRDVFA